MKISRKARRVGRTKVHIMPGFVTARAKRISAGYSVIEPMESRVLLSGTDPLPQVSISTPTPQIREPIPLSMMPIMLGQALVTRTGATTDALSVYLKVGGTAAAGEDYSIDPTQFPAVGNEIIVTIPAGAASATVFFVPLADKPDNGNETVDFAVFPTDAYSVGDPAAATITIIEPLQSLWVPYTPTAAQTSVTFLSQTGAISARVALSLWSFEFRVGDWGQVTQVGNQFTVDAKVERYTGPLPLMPIPINLPPILNDYALGALGAGDYSFVFKAWGQTVATADFSVPLALPLVSIKATDPDATEPNGATAGPLGAAIDTGQFTIARSGATDQPLIVALKVGGTASQGTDYFFSPNLMNTDPTSNTVQVLIPAGQSSATLNIIPLADNVVDGDETVTLSLVDTGAYTIGTSAPATVTIHEPTGGQWIQYVPTADQTKLAVQTFADGSSVAIVSLQFSDPGFRVDDWGTVQQNGADFSVDTKIERWTGIVPMYVPPPVFYKYPLGVLAPGDYSFTFEAWGQVVQTAKFTVPAAALPNVSIIATQPIATEPISGGPQPRMGSFTLARSGPAVGDLTVHLSVGGTATRGSDYIFGPFDTPPYGADLSVTIPDGYTWVPIPVLPKADQQSDGAETVVLTVASAPAYSVGAAGSATVTILETPPPILRIPDPNNPGGSTDVPVDLPGPGGKLDIGANELIVRLPDATAMGELLPYLDNLVRSGRDGGAWDGSGITSSAAAANPLTGLAVIPNTQDNSIVVKQALNGDVNLDGQINFDDYYQINTGFLSNGAKTGYQWGDLNLDGVINFDDYYLINQAFLGQTAAPAAGAPAAAFSTGPTVRHAAVRARLHKSASRLAGKARRPPPRL